ncbi:MAG: lipoprotein [Candidatus Thiodiazotropha taylori]
MKLGQIQPILMVLLIILSLYGCGQKGPLHHPSDQSSQPSSEKRAS